MNKQSNTTTTLPAPSLNDPAAQYTASPSALVQLSSEGSKISVLLFDQDAKKPGTLAEVSAVPAAKTFLGLFFFCFLGRVEVGMAGVGGMRRAVLRVGRLWAGRVRRRGRACPTCEIEFVLGTWYSWILFGFSLGSLATQGLIECGEVRWDEFRVDEIGGFWGYSRDWRGEERRPGISSCHGGLVDAHNAHSRLATLRPPRREPDDPPTTQQRDASMHRGP
ncbi:hypothetical protein DFP72DRAFT_1113656 [Ephemerocybe angulata]|uniref:Uncharacterized protein n=1 Tax=Ephemerocybe angulata TaxID=980116 RepID=A0A8H6H8Q7_9AGAR|nr:hypothetical protein DFP72DRAFT_1113656 [Tulosesus angulatus]